MANRRVYYGVYQVGVSICGANSFTSIHGLQGVGVTTKFNLEQIAEVGQTAIYANVENVPDVEVTLEKVLDGYPLIYHLATRGATSPTLPGRSSIKCTLGLSIYTDTQDSASGTPLAQCTMSGMYPSTIAYDIQVQGPAKESVTLVGNNKLWTNTFTAAAFNNTDEPMAITGSGGVNHRQDILFGATDTTVKSACLLPRDIPGITSSGTNELGADGAYGAIIQSIKTSVNLGRDALYQLGTRAPFFRYVQFPVQTSTDFEVLSKTGDQVQALENASSNVTDRTIYLMMREGTKIDLGTKNKLSQVTWGGANAGQGGGNATETYSYISFNDFTVTHPQDPSGL